MSYLYSGAYDSWAAGYGYGYDGLLAAPYGTVGQVVETVAAPAAVTTTTVTTTPAAAAAVVEPVAAAAPVAPVVAPVVTGHIPLPVYNHPHLDFALHAETLAEIDSRVHSVAAATARAPIVKRETIPVEGPLGRVKHIVKRLPTPAPDVIERTVIVKPHKDHVNVTIERPITPPPVLNYRQIVEDPGLPVVNHQVVAVPSRTAAVRAVSPIARVGTPLGRAYSPIPTSASYPNLISAYGYQSLF